MQASTIAWAAGWNAVLIECGTLPPAADSRQTPTLAARLMLRIPLKKYNEALRAATDRRARTAPCATSLARRQL